MKSSPRILIADDQIDVLEALRLLLKSEGFQIETATSPQQILNSLSARDFDVLLMDLNYTRDTTSGQEGLDLLSRIQTIDATLPVVVMTAWGSVDLAVEAMRRGARDFVQKPWENARLLSLLWTQIELGKALRKEQKLEAENQLLRGETRVAMISDPGAVFGEMSILLDTPHTATVRTLTPCELYFYEDASAFMRSDPEITFAIAALLAQRLNTATTYLADLKQQYAGAGSGLAMVSDVLASLVNQPARAYDPGSDREPNAS